MIVNPRFPKSAAVISGVGQKGFIAFWHFPQNGDLSISNGGDLMRFAGKIGHDTPSLAINYSFNSAFGGVHQWSAIIKAYDSSQNPASNNCHQISWATGTVTPASGSDTFLVMFSWDFSGNTWNVKAAVNKAHASTANSSIGHPMLTTYPIFQTSDAVRKLGIMNDGVATVRKQQDIYGPWLGVDGDVVSGLDLTSGAPLNATWALFCGDPTLTPMEPKSWGGNGELPTGSKPLIFLSDGSSPGFSNGRASGNKYAAGMQGSGTINHFTFTMADLTQIDAFVAAPFSTSDECYIQGSGSL